MPPTWTCGRTCATSRPTARNVGRSARWRPSTCSWRRRAPPHLDARLAAMSLRKIAQIGHPVLRQKARALTREELLAPATQQLIDDMIATMRDAQGAGLAAIQVYEPVRIAVIEVGQNQRYPYKPPIPLTVLVNPELTPVEDEKFDNYEGCLSVP